MLKINFDNTETAFKHKSDKSLKKAYYLFRAFGFDFLVKYGHIAAEVGFKLRLPVKPLIKSTIFEQFCGGETIDECHPIATKLYHSGIGSTLDYSVEGKSKESTFDQTFESLLRVLQKGMDRKIYTFAVFKPTGIGSDVLMEKVSDGQILTDKENFSYLRFVERFNSLLSQAYELKFPILIDAEESWLQNAIDELVYQAMAQYNKEEVFIYNTVQLYKKNQIPYIENQIKLAKEKGYKLGFKLVRGAYLEKENKRAVKLGIESPIQNTKADTDQDYDSAIDLCFENRDCVSFMAATHNESSTLKLAQLIEKNNLNPNDNRFHFGQLYGMSDHISYNLAPLNYNVVKYLPFGPVREVLPYMSRRAQENSSIKGQTSRELALIKKELQRRKEK